MKKIQIISFIIIFPCILLGQFTEVKHLSGPRGNISTAVLGETILFVGGWGDGDIVDYLNVQNYELTSGEYANDGFSQSLVFQNERFAVFYDLGGVNLLAANMYYFDNLNKKWYTEKYPSQASFSLHNGYIENNVAVFLDENDSEKFYTFNLITRIWGTKTARFTRRETTVIEVGEKIFFIGGKETFTERSDSVHVYNKANSTWEGFTISEAKNDVTAVQYEDKIVIAGGQSSNVNPNTSVDLVEIIDINDYSIETLNMSKGKNNLVGVVAGNKVIFAGGNSKNAEVIDMDNYTLTTHDFDVSKNLMYLGGASAGSKAVFGGGNDQDGDIVFVYDDDVEEWSTFMIDEPRSEMALVSVGNKIFAAGGKRGSGDTTFDEIYILENFPTSNFNALQVEEFVKISPNPTSEVLTIDADKKLLIEKVVLVGMDGRVVEKISEPGRNIDVSSLGIGTYVISFYTESKVFTTKFVKK